MNRLYGNRGLPPAPGAPTWPAERVCALGNPQQAGSGTFQGFVENLGVALSWLAEDGTILWANRAELELLGYSAEEYIGHHVTEFHTDGAGYTRSALPACERTKRYTGGMRSSAARMAPFDAVTIQRQCLPA